MPGKRKLTLSDPEILARLAAGETPQTLATAYGCTAQAVRERVKRLHENLPAPAARRAEETVSHTLDAFSAYEQSMAALLAMRDSLLLLLAHPTDERRLDLGTHDFDRDEGSRAADPRAVLLAVITQIRQHIELGVRLAERLHNQQEVERFMQEVLREIDAAAPDVATRIKGRLTERRTLRLALRPPGNGEAGR